MNPRTFRQFKNNPPDFVYLGLVWNGNTYVSKKESPNLSDRIDWHLGDLDFIIHDIIFKIMTELVKDIESA